MRRSLCMLTCCLAGSALIGDRAHGDICLDPRAQVPAGSGATNLAVANSGASFLSVLMNCAEVTVTGDVNGDGVVNFADLLAILSAWGPCKGCPEDLDGDGFAGFSDLLVVLSNWS